MTNKIRVIIADDHPVVLAGLRLTIEKSAEDIDIIGEALNGRAVLEIAADQRADVYVLDITMPDLNGIDTARRLLKIHPDAKIIILSLHDTKAFVEQALECGAKGYIVKETATQDVIEAIREVSRGNFFLSPSISHFLVNQFLDKNDHCTRSQNTVKLTSRERQVLQLIAEGHTSKEIAGQLDIAENTVHVHRNSLMSKLGIHKETDLVRYAVKAGIAKL